MSCPQTLTPTVWAHRRALRELRDIPEDEAEALLEKAKAASLRSHPARHAAVVQLSGTDLMRVRAGYYRAFVEYRMGRLYILLAGHRDGIYRDEVIERAERRSMHHNV